MDTDDLTDMAWDVIVRAARISDTLKAELGAITCRFTSEDEWLEGVRARLQKIATDPAAYVEYWGLENAEAVPAAMIGRRAATLRDRVDQVLATPLNERGSSPWGS